MNNPPDTAIYRPMSLLSTVGKVLEKRVHKNIFFVIRVNMDAKIRNRYY